MPENLNPEHQLEYLKALRKKYEEALSNAQKSGDYSEATKLKDELNERLTALESLFPKPEAKSEPMENNNELIEKGETSYEKAVEIMGEDFFGFEQVKKAFEAEFSVHLESTAIPYSSEELERAKSIGEMLVLRVGRLNDAPTTIHRMNEIVGSKMEDLGEGTLLFPNGWDRNDEFFKIQVVREGWALVSKDLIPYSTSNNYIDQTRVLRDHLIELNSLTEVELNEVTDGKLQEIEKLMETDLRAVAKQLSELKINQNHRRTPVEAVYDFIIRFKNSKNEDRMLETFYDWTNTLDSYGSLVRFGSADWEGAMGTSNTPDTYLTSLGVISVR